MRNPSARSAARFRSLALLVAVKLRLLAGCDRFFTRALQISLPPKGPSGTGENDSRTMQGLQS
jgi:hypothetical protein